MSGPKALIRQQIRDVMEHVGSDIVAIQVCFPQGLPPVPVRGPRMDIWRRPSGIVNAR